MQNFNQYLQNLESRNKLLSQDLKNLRSNLESIFKERVLEAGVFDRGYYSYFMPVLEEYRQRKTIKGYHITEEEFSDPYNGKVFRIPVVDITQGDNPASIRIFITSNV